MGSGMRLKPVRFGDTSAAGLRWVGGLPLPSGGTHYGGSVFPLSENVSVVAACLDRQINGGLHCPPLALDHVPTPIALGCVRRARVLSQDEAAALGIDQRHPHEVYFGCDVTDPAMADAYDRGQVLYGSPELRGSLVGVPYVDESGYDWPLFVGEFSVVGQPHNKSQVPADRLRGVTMADAAGRGKPMVDIEGLKAAAATLLAIAEQYAPDTADALQSAMEGVAEAVADEIASDMLGATADPDATMADPDEDEPAAPVMSDVHRRLRRLEQENARLRAERVVDEAMRTRSFGAATRDQLVKVAMSDASSWAAMLAVAAKRPTAQARVAMSGAPAGKPKGPAVGSAEFGRQVMDRAKVIMGERKGVTAPEATALAWSELTGGGAA